MKTKKDFFWAVGTAWMCMAMSLGMLFYGALIAKNYHHVIEMTLQSNPTGSIANLMRSFERQSTRIIPAISLCNILLGVQIIRMGRSVLCADPAPSATIHNPETHTA